MPFGMKSLPKQFNNGLPGLQGTDMKGMTRNTPDNFGMYRAVTLLEPIVKGQYRSGTDISSLQTLQAIKLKVYLPHSKDCVICFINEPSVKGRPKKRKLKHVNNENQDSIDYVQECDISENMSQDWDPTDKGVVGKTYSIKPGNKVPVSVITNKGFLELNMQSSGKTLQNELALKPEVKLNLQGHNLMTKKSLSEEKVKMEKEVHILMIRKSS
ncbi:unnamed protein product [Mytilus edulis]|uniref:Uncharacterized protein n=1 Tax=Mytilus edulis TaxID=6550 RepID=A0A8S3UYY8_MYTED|nr:unnamed protein product [Mytilus edulis]